MGMLNATVRYFDLYSHRRIRLAEAQDDSPSANVTAWLAAQYFALWLGILSKEFIDSVAPSSDEPAGSGEGKAFWIRLVLSLIIATALFPAAHGKAMDESAIDHKLPGLVQLCSVFAMGLGYKTLVDIEV